MDAALGVVSVAVVAEASAVSGGVVSGRVVCCGFGEACCWACCMAVWPWTVEDWERSSAATSCVMAHGGGSAQLGSHGPEGWGA